MAMDEQDDWSWISSYVIKCAFPPAIIRNQKKMYYFRAIERACLRNNYNDVTREIGEAVQDSLDLYLLAADKDDLEFFLNFQF